MTRGAYGADAVYAKMAWDSLAEWKGLSARAGLPIFHETGVLFFFPEVEPYVTQSLAVHKQLGLATAGARARGAAAPLPADRLERDRDRALRAALRRTDGAPRGADSGRRVRPGGRRATSRPRSRRRRPKGARLDHVLTATGRKIAADQFVFACGPWLPKLFPDTLGTRIFPTRQEVFFFAPEAGDGRFAPGQLPGWADFNEGDIYYGFPDLEGRGFKIAHDAHGVPVDPDRNDRTYSAQALADVRAFMRAAFRRSPTARSPRRGSANMRTAPTAIS